MASMPMFHQLGDKYLRPSENWKQHKVACNGYPPH